MKKTRAIDANVILRFLLNDHIKLSLRAQSIIHKAEQGEYFLLIDEVIVAEVVWVLTSFFKVSREVVADKLMTLMVQPWVKNKRKPVVLAALSLFKQHNIDYIDVWLLCVSQREQISVETFDSDLQRLLSKVKEKGETKN